MAERDLEGFCRSRDLAEIQNMRLKLFFSGI